MQLPTVEVQATSLRNDLPGSFVEHWSTKEFRASKISSIADFLRSKSGIYIKTYSAGNLATASIRGASASQTAVIWNGFQVQSPMLGLLDWSLHPVEFSDEISLQHGGNSAIWGSGAVGGAVLIENKPDFTTQKSLRLEAGAGSFGWKNGSIKAQLANDNLSSSTSIFLQKADNDFQYAPSPGLPDRQQTNAGQYQVGLSQAFHWKPLDEIQIAWTTWLQRAYREIPPLTTQTRSVANQKDGTFRTALNVRWSYRKSIIQARSAIFRESIHYKDELAGIDTPSHFWTSISEVEFLRNPTQSTTLQIAGNQTFTKAFIKNYQSPAVRNQTALFASLRFKQNHTAGQLDGRIELVDGNFAPFTPSIGIEHQIKNWLKIGAKVGRNYRLPTLNDLHWTPGGNPNLLPEKGWSCELNTQISLKRDQSTLQLTSALFNRNIKNWILWRPAEGQPFWSASNIAEVWSRGIENRFDWTWRAKNWGWEVNAAYDYVRSTNEVAVKLPKIEAGQQLIYVPENQGFAGLELQIRKVSLDYHHNFTGSVLTELGRLPSFQTGDASIQLDKKIMGLPCQLQFSVNNCWNQSYQVIERRPMPGRNFRLSFSTTFTKN